MSAPVTHTDCNWWCSVCKRCHANACPSLWGGAPEVPCGHTTDQEVSR